MTATYTCFEGHRRIASGPLVRVALAVKRACEGGLAGQVLIFEDTTGHQTDINTRGSEAEVIARYAGPAPQQQPGTGSRARSDSTQTDADESRGRGRPKLGVVSREVTLLPRHWDWLNAQPGGASVVLRRLVEEARRTHAGKDRARMAQERAYHFMSAMAGDLPGYEEAIRALFADDERRFRETITAWPRDIRDYANALAFGDETWNEDNT